jgi:hypothetical protein
MEHDLWMTKRTRKRFSISGAPDEDSCIWLASGKGQGAVVVNMSPREAVAERLAQWLGKKWILAIGFR